MPIDRREHVAREIVQAAHSKIEPQFTDSKALIRFQALQKFLKELDGKLANLQEGETLLLTFRIDIQRSSGEIRGGSGSQRNMPEYIQWRKNVFKRDGYVCKECGSKKNIQAHHIKHWISNPNLRFDIDNGVTLCDECHTKKHPHLRFIRRNK